MDTHTLLFLPRLLDTDHSVDELEMKFSVDQDALQDALQDMEWQLKFSANWNGKAFFSGGKVDP